MQMSLSYMEETVAAMKENGFSFVPVADVFAQDGVVVSAPRDISYRWRLRRDCRPGRLGHGRTPGLTRSLPERDHLVQSRALCSITSPAVSS